MSFGPAPSKGAWFNPAGLQAWTQAAQTYKEMAPRVEEAATSAAQAHIVDPMIAGIRGSDHPEAQSVADSLAVVSTQTRPNIFSRKRPNLQIGLSDASLNESASDIEYGDGESAPGAYFRSALTDGRYAAQNAFYEGLLGGDAA